MKIKKLISAFCLAAGLTLAVPALSSTLGVPDVISTVSAAEGWNQDENGWYYLQGDTKLLGLQAIGNDKYYYLSCCGNRYGSSVCCNGTKYIYINKVSQLIE